MTSIRQRVLAGSDTAVGVVALIALFPTAGGMPAMSGGNPLADGFWFLLNLGGALLLLAAGIASLLPRIKRSTFIASFATLIVVLGLVRFEVSGFSQLLPGWLLLGTC